MLIFSLKDYVRVDSLAVIWGSEMIVAEGLNTGCLPVT
jgi:hypothetical protein